MSPPSPLLLGSTTPITAFVAIAASIALPPRSRICTPARTASGWLVATRPYRVATFDRPTRTRGCGDGFGAVALAAGVAGGPGAGVGAGAGAAAGAGATEGADTRTPGAWPGAAT